MPPAVRDFVTGSCQNLNKIYVLLVNMQLLTNGNMLTRSDYDYLVEGFYRPFDALKATRPVVIIDEPHRFSREQKAYKAIVEELCPQLIIRYGAICYYKISRKMVSLITKDPVYAALNYYNDLFIKKDSILNRNHTHKRDYVQSQILKLTFAAEERWVSEELLSKLEKTNNTRVGYYDRHSGEQTILVSIKNTCDSATKRYAAYKTLKCTINYLRRIPSIDSCDPRFLLTAKFFLFYLFDENPVVIKPTISRDTCVICTRGKNTRIRAIQNLLKSSVGNEDENHEVEFLLSQISNDSINDTTITIPASILVCRKDAVGRKLSEFDGIIIHPMRKEQQVIFLEAKNRDRKPSFGKNCLVEKFGNFFI